jgi:AcrR family transcriptional regulator
MPRLSEASQANRRNRILDAAEICFAGKGFHAATMQDICVEAGISPGALYLYFASKVDLIAGIAERDRREIAEGMAKIGEAAELIPGLAAMARHYLIERPAHKTALMVEIGAEAARNPAIAKICRAVDATVHKGLRDLIALGQARGEIAAAIDPGIAALQIQLVGDGAFWRKAVNADFDAETAMHALMGAVGAILQASGPALAPHGINGQVQHAESHGAVA